MHSERNTQLRQLRNICDSIRKQMNNGRLTGAVSVDMSKVFGTSGHSVLLQKILKSWSER